MARLNDTKIPITDFLDAYRRQPCLYNSIMDTYKNRVAREAAYEAIIKTLKIPQLNVMDIKLKIKSVRTVYTKELRILLREKEMGRSYEPKLFWFKRADAFLRSVSLSHCKRLRENNAKLSIKQETEQQLLFNAKETFNEDEQQNLDDDGDHEDGSEMETSNTNVVDNSAICMLEEHQHQLPQQQTTTMLRKLRYLPSNSATLNQRQSTPFSAPTPAPAPSPTQQQQPDLSCSSSVSFNTSDDDLNIFGQSIASQLRSIPDPYSRSVAKLRIQQVLFEAETGQSSESVNPQLPSSF